MAFMLNDNPYLRERDELLAHLVDDGTISAEQARRERWRARGICSDPDCEQAIDGWCEGCGAKLCADDLDHHEWRHDRFGDCERDLTSPEVFWHASDRRRSGDAI